jgi:protein TonB
MLTSSAPFSASTSHRTLMWALGVSVLVHAALLTLKWVSPTTFDRIFESNTLEVVLVLSLIHI